MPSARSGHLLPGAHLQRRRERRPGADALRRAARLAARRPLVGEWGAELTGERGLSSVGAVVGATVPAPSPRRASCCRAPSCCCRASAPRAPPPRMLPRIHERPRERSRHRLPLGDLCIRGRTERWPARPARGRAAAPASRPSRAGDAATAGWRGQRPARLPRSATVATCSSARASRTANRQRRPRHGRGNHVICDHGARHHRSDRPPIRRERSST